MQRKELTSQETRSQSIDSIGATKMVKTCFSTLSCPDWSWNQILTKGVEYGFGGVEVRLVARETDLLTVPELQSHQLSKRRNELANAGFEVCGLASSVHFHDDERHDREEQQSIGRAYVDLAQELGASFVRVFGDVVGDQSDESHVRTIVSRVADGLQNLGEYAAECKVDILIETHGDFCESPLLKQTLRNIDCDAVGVVWDTHHPWRFFGEDVAVTFERLKPWVRHTHWKDSVSKRSHAVHESEDQAAREAANLMSGHRHADYALFGDGEFPAAACMQLLHDDGYDGWFSMEWEKMWHPEIEEPEIVLPPFPQQIRKLWETAETAG